MHSKAQAPGSECKRSSAAETLPNSLKEIYQCYMKLVEEIKRAESVKHTVSQAYEKGYKLDFGSDPVGVQLYLNHRLELNSDLKAIVNMSNTNVSPALYAKQLQCEATSCSVERSFSMLGKLLVKDCQFAQDNVWKYLALYVNKTSAE